jgi:hypothetical protein
MKDQDDPGSFIKEKNTTDLANLRKIDLTYNDFDREYGASVQNIYYPRSQDSFGVDNDAAVQVQTPVVLVANEARYLADKLLYAKRLNERQVRVVLPFRYAYLDPADTITLTVSPTESLVIRITRVTLTLEFNVEVEGVFDDPDIYNDDPNIGGTFGRFYRLQFAQPGPFYTPYVFDHVPQPYSNPLMVPQAANGTAFNGNWFCLLDIGQDNASPVEGVNIRAFSVGSTQEDLPQELPRSVTPREIPTWGYVISAPANPSNALTVQTDSEITIKVMNERPGWEFTTSNLSWEDGSFWATNTAQGWQGNTISVGSELIRFHTVTDNMDGTYTLSKLIRCLGNTLWAYNNNKRGRECVLMSRMDGTFDADALQPFASQWIQSTGVNDWAYLSGQFFQSFSLLAQSGNPHALPLVSDTASYDWVVPNVWNVLIDKNVSNEYVITWDRASRFISVKSGTTDNYLEEWYDAGDDAQQYFVGDEVARHIIYLSDSPLFEDGGTTLLSSASTYLRREEVEGSLSFTYTAAMQATDGFTHGSDTLYVWVVTNSIWGGETWREPETYSKAP